MKRLLIQLLCIPLLLACSTKDGVIIPQDGIFKIMADDKFIEANNYTVNIPSNGGKFSYIIQYGAPSATTTAQFGPSTGGMGTEYENDGIVLRLLDDVVYSPINQLRGTIQQTLEITAKPNNGNRTKKLTATLITLDSHASTLIVRQKGH